jgi:hypothetical protein
MIMEYTHVEYCNMLVILGTCNILDGTAAREYTLLCPSRRYPESVVFRLVAQSLPKVGSVPSTAHVKAGRP